MPGDLIQRWRFRACENEDLAHCRLDIGAQHDSVDEIVDVHHVQLRSAAADHHENAASDGPIELQEAQVSLAIDRAGPYDDDTLAAPRRVHDGALGLELGALIDVAGAERVALIGRRMGDVSMHAAGRAVNDPLAVEAARGLEHIAGAAYVDVAVIAVGMPGRAEHCRDVVNLVAAARGGNHIIERRKLSNAHLYAVGGERLRLRRIPHQRPHLAALSDETSSEITAGEAGGAGDENSA